MGQQIELKAPGNPYRRYDGTNGEALMPMVDVGMDGEMSGPGLLADDIDRIARRHHAMGRREAELEADTRVVEMQARLATAFDQGFAAGRVERAVGLAESVRAALMAGAWWRVLGMRDAKTKAKLAEAAELAIGELRDVLDMLDAVRGSNGAGDGAGAVAALVADREMSRRPVT